MLWQLVLAHFLADYPFQPERVARNKHRPGMLLLHAGVHFLIMLLVVLPWVQMWPYLLGIAAVHFGIDAAKTWLNIRRPEWVAWPYLFDQAAHLLTLALFSHWMLAAVPHPDLYLSQKAAVAATGFLLVTHVYLITERVLTGGGRENGTGLPGRVWARMALRGALLAALLVGWDLRVLALAGLSSQVFSSAQWEDVRAVLADLLFTVAVAALVILINTRPW